MRLFIHREQKKGIAAYEESNPTSYPDPGSGGSGLNRVAQTWLFAAKSSQASRDT